ncbi:interleukin-17 receptor D isoform X1 [Haplochromis burtoni]|uniref:interleukin-17 receptor D isoform X1 n=1 Tax=Haplochromis burtoni TaxID=8153 RepID=UPI0003BDCAF6|nr:interleukin-17 receptor D isoform X1 [Haplochromis burtoni]
MWELLYLFLTLCQLLCCQAEATAAPITPQSCSLDCIQQGGPACEYCRITRSDVRKALGFKSIERFGSCIPWPCFELLGNEDPKICQHYVQAPNDVKVEFLNDSNSQSDTIIVSWKPSYYGIAFLRGFQVSLQALGGTSIACQLFLFHRNLSLPTSHAQRVYKSDPFPGLSLGSQYAVTVMALPVPEEWESFYRSEIFSTRSCAEKNGFEQCKNDWYPKHIEVQQEGTAITVTFNLAPPNLGIRSYFSLCYTNGRKKYTDIIPDLTTNKTHHSYQLSDLQEGTNYTCEIAANEVDAVRKMFNVHVEHSQKEDASPRSVTPSLAFVLPLSLVAVAVLGGCLAIVIRRRTKLQMKKFDIQLDIINKHEEVGNQEELVSLRKNRLTPPRLLICYSSHEGPAHVKAVMQLGVFIQQHMATQVCLDLWDSLSVAEEGSMAWHCRQIRESDFVLVMCSRGFNQRPKPEDDDGDEDQAYSSDAIIQLIGAEVGRAKAWGQDLSKYMAAIFEYSEETDIPTELRLISHYVLTSDLPLLFSHLHGVALHRPGAYLKIDHISEKGFAKVPAGAALQWAIYEAGMALEGKGQHSLEEGD